MSTGYRQVIGDDDAFAALPLDQARLKIRMRHAFNDTRQDNLSENDIDYDEETHYVWEARIKPQAMVQSATSDAQDFADASTDAIMEMLGLNLPPPIAEAKAKEEKEKQKNKQTSSQDHSAIEWVMVEKRYKVPRHGNGQKKLIMNRDAPAPSFFGKAA